MTALPRCRARYVIIRPRPAHNVVAVQDVGDKHMSVTNEIENVIAQLVALGDLCKYQDMRLIYRDSEGQWDEALLTPDCRFAGYRVIGATSIKGALLDMNIWEDQ